MYVGAATRQALYKLCLCLGLGALIAAGLCGYREKLRLAPAGATAGGAVTAVELCRRSTPPDMAAACLAEQERLAAQARTTILGLLGLGLGSLVLAAGLRRLSRTPTSPKEPP